jgi:hypothetical protein
LTGMELNITSQHAIVSGLMPACLAQRQGPANSDCCWYHDKITRIPGNCLQFFTTKRREKVATLQAWFGKLQKTLEFERLDWLQLQRGPAALSTEAHPACSGSCAQVVPLRAPEQGVNTRQCLLQDRQPRRAHFCRRRCTHVTLREGVVNQAFKSCSYSLAVKKLAASFVPTPDSPGVRLPPCT